ncbi:MAG: MBL fold metallo-hydrolase [Bacilli bacterium]|nr:MBL fold metallo-hydrolase [Bacilli bacterium]
MQVKIIKVGLLEENCYILIQDNKCLIVDPGDDFFLIDPQIDNNQVIGVLITHEHKDHIGALNQIVKKYNPPIYKFSNLEEKRYEIENFRFEVIFNPGHTKDSVSFYFYEYNFNFVGDFIFKNTIGRTDLEGGNPIDMEQSLRKISTYNKRMKMYPGHGEPTYLQDELENNYYLRRVNQ